jgi:hypothetical protein
MVIVLLAMNNVCNDELGIRAYPDMLIYCTWMNIDFMCDCFQCESSFEFEQDVSSIGTLSYLTRGD